MTDLIVQGNFVLVRPWRTYMEPSMTCRRTVGNPSVRIETVHEPLYTVVDGTGFIPIGLLEQMCAFLDKRGAKYRADTTDIRLPVPDMSHLPELRYGQRHAIDVVAENKCGIVSGPTGSGKTFVIEQVVLMYPDLNILILTPRKPVAKSILRRVLGHLGAGGAVMNDGSHKPKWDSERVVVSTLGSLHKVPDDWPELILFDEMHGAASGRAGNLMFHLLMENPDCRMFGFSATPSGRHDGADLLGTALFGPVRHDMTYKEAQNAGIVVPLRVLMFEVPDPLYLPDTFRDMSTELRHGIWRNETRNQLIAEVVESRFADDQVLIMVATAEHALCIHEQLPDSVVVCAPLDAKQKRKFKKSKLLHDGTVIMPADEAEEQFKSGKLRRVVTTVWKEGIDFPSLPVLVRADGMASVIKSVQIPGRLSRLSEGKSMGVLVDFLDEFHPSFRRRAQLRERKYKKQEWTVTHEHL